MRNRTLLVGTEVVQPHRVEMAKQPAAQVTGPVVFGLDGGYVRNRRGSEKRDFEVIVGKVFAAGAQHRFAFTRKGHGARCGGRERGRAWTVLCDGDAGLWRLQRTVLPGVTVVLDC